MPEIDTTQNLAPAGADAGLDGNDTPRNDPRRGLFSPRYLLVYFILLALILLAILPPLLNVNRFKRRIATSISASIGRPVHLDSVTLVLLPFPGFRIENFVVSEDPAFGSEPLIRANNVLATLRFSSLWQREVEFSKISLQEPSINLVHNRRGGWNFQGILTQAAHISVAPTAQTTHGSQPRFPYIEASDARLNIKSGDEKLPFSLTETDFALWLPDPQQWRLRLQGKPTRTDSSASDTGIISIEGSLGRAERFDQIPIDLAGEWKNAPLGEASRVLTGRDANIRGDMKLSATAHGTIGNSTVKTVIELKSARRADFVPQHPLDIHAECQAIATETFHAFRQIRCSWPQPGEPVLLALTGDLPEIHNPDRASFELGTPGLPASVLLNWLRVASPRVSNDVTATGSLTGKLAREPGTINAWNGNFDLKGASLVGGNLGDAPVILGDVAIAHTGPADGGVSPRTRHGKQTVVTADNPPTDQFVMAPTTLSLGGKDPATLEGTFDGAGYSLHLSGNVLPSRLLALASSIPQFGDGIAENFLSPAHTPAKEVPIYIDITSSRVWGGGQSWSRTVTPPTRGKRR